MGAAMRTPAPPPSPSSLESTNPSQPPLSGPSPDTVPPQAAHQPPDEEALLQQHEDALVSLAPRSNPYPIMACQHLHCHPAEKLS